MMSRKVLLNSVTKGVNKCVSSSPLSSALRIRTPSIVSTRTVFPSVSTSSWISVRCFHLSNSCFTDEDPKLVANEDWAKRLTPEQYFCTREGGTEPPFSGQYLNHKAEGVYACVCCGVDLFNSKAKYDSGSGWPSFHSTIEDGNNSSNVRRRKDISHGMVRNEILCNNCNSHLGHVFEDGPDGKERHCVNSAALKFQPRKLS